MQNIDKYKNMSDEELHKLSLQKNKKGSYTREANMAYMERRRRSGIVQYEGVANRCGKYYGDFVYYGYCD